MTPTIAFLAGCINNQRNFPRESHYHAVLKTSLSRMYSADLNFNFAVYHAYGQLFEKATGLISKNRPDILVIFIRPFPFLILNKPLVKYEESDNRKVRDMHPALFFRNKFEWPEKYFINIKEASSAKCVSRSKFELRDLNLLAGIILGLNRWAMKFVLQELKRVISLCRQENIELIFLGMPQNRESIIGSYICSFMNKKLISEFSKTNVIYLNIHSEKDANGQPIFFGDGIHFNEAGHLFLKDNLMPDICRIINEKYGL